MSPLILIVTVLAILAQGQCENKKRHEYVENGVNSVVTYSSGASPYGQAATSHPPPAPGYSPIVNQGSGHGVYGSGLSYGPTYGYAGQYGGHGLDGAHPEVNVGNYGSSVTAASGNVQGINLIQGVNYGVHGGVFSNQVSSNGIRVHQEVQNHQIYPTGHLTKLEAVPVPANQHYPVNGQRPAVHFDRPFTAQFDRQLPIGVYKLVGLHQPVQAISHQNAGSYYGNLPSRHAQSSSPVISENSEEQTHTRQNGGSHEGGQQFHSGHAQSSSSVPSREFASQQNIVAQTTSKEETSGFSYELAHKDASVRLPHEQDNGVYQKILYHEGHQVQLGYSNPRPSARLPEYTTHVGSQPILSKESAGHSHEFTRHQKTGYPDGGLQAPSSHPLSTVASHEYAPQQNFVSGAQQGSRHLSNGIQQETTGLHQKLVYPEGNIQSLGHAPPSGLTYEYAPHQNLASQVAVPESVSQHALSHEYPPHQILNNLHHPSSEIPAFSRDYSNQNVVNHVETLHNAPGHLANSAEPSGRSQDYSQNAPAPSQSPRYYYEQGSYGSAWAPVNQ